MTVCRVDACRETHSSRVCAASFALFAAWYDHTALCRAVLAVALAEPQDAATVSGLQLDNITCPALAICVAVR